MQKRKKKFTMVKAIEKTKQKIQSEVTVHNASQVERLIAHHFDGLVLEEAEEMMYRRMVYVTTLWQSKFPETLIVKTLAKGSEIHRIDAISESHARRVIRDSKKIFGDAVKIDKELERKASIEFYKMVKVEVETLAQQGKIEWKDAYNIILQAMANADKLAGLFDKDEKSRNGDEFDENAVIIIPTTDINVLRAMVQDIDYEEVKDAE